MYSEAPKKYPITAITMADSNSVPATTSSTTLRLATLGLPVAGGSHFLLGTATLSILSDYHGIGAVEYWNMPLVT